ncbi:MAG TPA: ABC transporter substrate-binding protein [Kofleriaceae bacterium]|nr:ABC transporter substrate-binding protein [Kofleriaceae bacterium]
MSRARAIIPILACTLVLGCERTEPSSAKPAAETASDSSHQGGHVVLPSVEPRFLNPVLATRFNRVGPLIFEGLVDIGPKLEPVPRLAESWKVTDGGKTLTFTLRKGVTWHDGKPFSSADVKFTFDAIRRVPQSVWKAYMAGVSSVETPDPQTVVVHYEKPYAPALKTWTVGILPAHVFGTGKITDSPANRQPIGTGPYKLSRWELGKMILLSANESWWYGRPNIDTVEIAFGTDDAVEKLKARKLDFAQIRDIRTWREMQDPAVREDFASTSAVEASFRTIAWNTTKAPFNDPKVRIALTCALNRGRVIEDVLLGQARPLSAPFFPNMFGADPSIAPYPFDLEKAKKLLDEAGVTAKEDGTRFSIKLIIPKSYDDRAAKEGIAIFRRDLDTLGIDLQAEFLPTKELFEHITSRDFDAMYFGWLPDISDPDPYALLHSSQIGTAANFAGFSDPEIDKLLEAARSTVSRDERKAIYHKVHALFHAQVPYTMLYAPVSHYAWNRRLHGVNPRDIGPQAGFPGLARWWVSER